MSKVKTTKKTNPLLEDQEEEVLVESEEIVEEEVTVAPKKASKKVDVVIDYQSDISATKKTLENEEQVHFLVPLSEGEKPGSVHECFINGYKYSVEKGIMTTVPQSIANLLANYYNIGMNAGSDFRVDLNSQKRDALQG
jgi:hypothetical protein